MTNISQLNKEDIFNYFMDNSNEKINRSWNQNDRDSINDTFFNKISNFHSFLQSYKDFKSISIFPIEALIWAYGNNSETSLLEYNSVETFYYLPRNNQLNPKSTSNKHITDLFTDVLYRYFLYIRSGKNHQKRNIKKILKYDLEYNPSGTKSIDMNIAIYLNKMFSEWQDNTILSELCGQTLYRSERLLKFVLSLFFQSKFGFVPNNLKKDTKLVFIPKEKGIHFGIIAQAGAQKFYIKVHCNYPIRGDKNESSSTYTQISTSPFSNEVSSVPNCQIHPLRNLDLKELFVYKFFERLSYGPKTFFVQQHEIESYTLIVTESENRFISFNDEQLNFDSLRQLSKKKNKPSNENNEKFIVNLTRFDIIARCMRVTDLNSGNFGLLKPIEGSNIELYQPFVVDFLVSKPLTNENEEFIRALQEKVRKEMSENKKEEAVKKS